jgi:hypothetical protein
MRLLGQCATPCTARQSLCYIILGASQVAACPAGGMDTVTALAHNIAGAALHHPASGALYAAAAYMPGVADTFTHSSACSAHPVLSSQ